MTDPKKPAPDEEDDDEPSKVTINVDVNEDKKDPKPPEPKPSERKTVERTTTERKTTS